MEKSVKNAVFKGFPVLMESDTVGSKQGQAAYLPSLFSTDSQLSSKIKTNFQSNFFRGFYLVAKCMNKRGADPSAIGLPMLSGWFRCVMGFMCFWSQQEHHEFLATDVLTGLSWYRP